MIIFQTNHPTAPFVSQNKINKPIATLSLVFKQEALEKPDTPLNKMKHSWLTNKNNHLQNCLIDTGAATEDLVQKVQIYAEKNIKFKRGSKQLDLNILLEL